MENTGKEIISLILKELGIKAPTFANNIGVKYQRILDIQNGKTKKVSSTVADAIIERYPQFNRIWLLTGEGEMLKSQETLPENYGGTPDDQSDQLFHTVPLVPTSAQGGPLNDFVTSIKENECERIVSPVKYADLAITVAGDSMAPEFPSGCQILIKRINEKAFIEWGKVYVLDTCNGTVIKEVHRGKAADEIECYSINPDPKFQPFSVKFADIFGMYRVIMCMSLK